LNSKGEVIGVLSFKLKGAENLNFVIPINYARGLLNATDSLTLKEFNEKVQSSKVAFSESNVLPVLPKTWKSVTTPAKYIVRQSEDYIYLESVFPESARRAGQSSLWELKKDGSTYAGFVRGRLPCSYTHFLLTYSKICEFQYDVRLTLFTPTRIECIVDGYKRGARLDCRTCTFNPPGSEPYNLVLIPE
jgi:hypothetical protein